MALPVSRARLAELWRYYQAGVVNTAFGFGLFSALVWIGLNIFVAQLISHFCGVAFNYVMYSRHVFRDAEPAKLRFMLSYVGNYLLGLAALALSSRIFPSPYVAGAFAIIVVSIINYFLLKRFVFKPEPD